MSKQLKYHESGFYEEVTREEIIERLIDDDIDTIMNDDGYLYNILKSGFRGYDKALNNDLIRDWYDRIDPDLSKPNIKIVKKARK